MTGTRPAGSAIKPTAQIFAILFLSRNPLPCRPPTVCPSKRWQGGTCYHRERHESPTTSARSTAACGTRGAERSDQGVQGLRDTVSHPSPDVQGRPVVLAGSDRGRSCAGPVDGAGGVHCVQGDERDLRVLREVRRVKGVKSKIESRCVTTHAIWLCYAPYARGIGCPRQARAARVYSPQANCREADAEHCWVWARRTS